MSLALRVEYRGIGRIAHPRNAGLVDDPPAGLQPELVARCGLRRQRRAAHVVDDLTEGPLHVARLPAFVVAPLKAEAQDGNTPAIDDAGVDLAVAVGIRDHLASARKADHGAVVSAVVRLEAAAPAAARGIPLDGAQHSEARHPAAATRLDVIPAREVQRGVVEPPWHVDVHAGAILVVGHTVHERRDKARDRGASRIGQVAADGAAGVRQAVGKSRGSRIQEQARRFAGARGQHHDTRANLMFLPGGRVDVGHAGRETVSARRHLACHGAGDQCQPAGSQGRREQDRRRREVGRGAASAAALATIVAGGASVERLGQNRDPGRDARNAEPIAGLLHQQLVASWPRRRLEDAVGFVRQALLGSVQADETIQLVVVGLQLVVGDWPVVAEAVEAPAPEVVRTVAERDAAPVVRPSAEHPRAEPVESLPVADGVGLALEFPPAEAGVEFTEWPVGARAAARRLVRPRQHLGLARGIPHRAGLEQDGLGAGFGEHLGRHAAAGAGPDDTDVVDARRAANLHPWRHRAVA